MGSHEQEGVLASAAGLSFALKGTLPFILA